MCGIVGFNWEEKALLKRMSDRIIYRGPDDVAYYSDDKVSLGMRRLSIIDLKKGIYPITNESGEVFTVFNGEIYNFKELRNFLIKKGHSFKTSCDGEVIVHAYEEYGEDFVKHLNGMFAIALYDSKKQTLMLIRDRLGIKPLYYYAHGKKLMFASEIKSILEYDEFKKEVNLEALNNYLSLRYNPLEETFFKGVKRILPGHLLKLNLKTSAYEIKKYWDIDINFDSKTQSSKYYEERLRELLKDSVQKMLISDVPLGVFLSGGIDSSAIVAMIHELRKEGEMNGETGNDAPIRTYNVSFLHGEKVNESKYAKQVSELFGTEHQEFMIEPDVCELLPKIAWQTDEPLADPALIPLYLLSESAKKTSTVVLTGDGGDELFAGYEHHRFLKAANMASKVSLYKPIGKTLSRALPLKVWDKFHKYSSDLGKEAYTRGDEVINNIKHNKAKAYYSLIGVFSDSERQLLLNEEQYEDIDYDKLNSEYFESKKSSNNQYMQQLLLFDTKRILAENFLMKTDRMTMAQSIEARVPLLDHRMAEFAFHMPPQLKLQGINGTKHILKKSLVGKLPKEILYRKKQSFNMPIENWLNTELKDMVDQMLAKERLPPMLNHDYVTKIQQKYSTGKLYYARQLWSLLTFTLWYRKYMQ